MGERGRRLIEDHYQWSAIARRMAQRYGELRDARRRSAVPAVDGSAAMRE